MLKTSVDAYFKRRRDQLMSKNPGAAFVLPSTPEYPRNHDTHYEFRQESNFYYLTGFDEPNSVLVMVPDTSTPGRTYQTILFVMKRDMEREIWNGERYGVDRAKTVFQVDQTYPIDELDLKLPELLKDAAKLFYKMGLVEANDRKIITALQTTVRNKGRTGLGLMPVEDPYGVIGDLRLFKTPEEVETLRRVCKITAMAHKEAMIQAKPGMNEYEIAALVEYLFKKNGCERLAYGSIVAGGKNATCLHYMRNNEVLRDGDLLLIDAGGELDYIAADITRTFPIGKAMSKEQRTLYDLVLKCQKEIIKMVKPGIPYSAMHTRAVELLTEGLLSIGLLKGKKDEMIQKNLFKRFYPHGTGHYLGMDVHDAGLYGPGSNRLLEPGMVFTIEPGLYVQPEDGDAPAEYRGIGIRIEDDVLVTPNGCEVFTSDVPKEIADIENLKK